MHNRLRPTFRPLLASAIVLTGILASPGRASAGELQKNEKAVIETVKKDAISGDLGVTVLNQYNARGIIVEDEGVIFQPYFDLYFKLYEGEGFINSISLQTGLWADLSSSAPLASAGSTTRHFTEIDWSAGFIVKFAERFTLSTYYYEFYSPSDSYQEGRNINTILTYDDSGLIAKNFSIKPHLTVLYELPAPNQSGLKGHSWYFEPGITPNYTFFAESKTPLNVALDVRVGLGSSFYNGDTVGYVSAGPQITAPLGFIPESYGAWTASAGYRYYWLNDNLEAIAPAQRGDQHLFQFSVGLTF